MIHIVTTMHRRYTTRHLVRSLRPHIRRWSYEALFRRRTIPAGTWIFTDHERLTATETALAAEIAKMLVSSGQRVLNHPSQVRGRFALQQALLEKGINSFRTYRADESPAPSRFPVFLRDESDHRGSIGDLIESQEELQRTLSELSKGRDGLRGKLVVEYAGEEVEPGIWHRYAAYCVGGEIIPHHKALDSTWQVKDGFDAGRLSGYRNCASFIAGERAFVMDGEHLEVLRVAFAIAGLDYGRADFAIRDGSPQIFEINTNPYHARPSRLWRTIHPDRAAAQQFSENRLRHALLSLDQPASGEIRLDSPLLRPHQSFMPLLWHVIDRP